MVTVLLSLNISARSRNQRKVYISVSHLKLKFYLMYIYPTQIVNDFIIEETLLIKVNAVQS